MRGRRIFHGRALIMGIVNVNDDSFSGDGSLDAEELIGQILQKIAEGADIIDLGAESARTNREAITEEEEGRRIVMVLEQWEEIVAMGGPRDEKQIFPPILSVNTWRPGVIKRLLGSEYSAEIEIINDMSALAFPEVLLTLKDHHAYLLIMHSVGLPKEDHSGQRWGDVTQEVKQFFQEKIQVAEEGGVSRERLILDPGLDFAKQSKDSLQLIQRARELAELGLPVLYPLSRKTFIGEVLKVDDPPQRDAGTVATLPFLVDLPECIVRVHNVDAAYCSIRVLEKISLFSQ